MWQVIIILAMDIKNLCHHEILTENEAVNVARHHKFLRRQIHIWYDSQKHLMTTPDLIADQANEYQFMSV